MAEGQLKKRRIPKGRHLSVIKRERQSARRRRRNLAVKSSVKTLIRKVRASIAAKDKTAAIADLKLAMGRIHKAASQGVFHRRTAARKVSRLSEAVHSLAL